MYNNPYPYNNNIQQQLAQNRMEQLQNQYNTMFPNVNMMQQQGQQNMLLKGRPVSSLEEARASMIDLDGSMFIFTDIANKKIYTKQIMLDGTAELKTYILEEQKQTVQNVNAEKNGQEYVLRSDFEKIMNKINKQLEVLKEGIINDESINESDV